MWNNIPWYITFIGTFKFSATNCIKNSWNYQSFLIVDLCNEKYHFLIWYFCWLFYNFKINWDNSQVFTECLFLSLNNSWFQHSFRGIFLMAKFFWHAIIIFHHMKIHLRWNSYFWKGCEIYIFMRSPCPISYSYKSLFHDLRS